MIHLIRKALQNLLRSMRTEKKLWITLFFLQLVVLGVFLSLFLSTQLRAMQEMQVLLQQVQGANYNPSELQEGEPFLQDPLVVYQSYRALKEQLLKFLWQSSLLYLLGQGLLWLLTQSLVHRLLQKPFARGRYVLQFLGSTFLLALFFVASYLLIKKQFTLQMEITLFQQTLRSLVVVFVVLYYLVLCAYALPPIHSGKLFIKQWFFTAIRKYYVSIPLLLLSLLPAALSLAVIYYALLRSSFLVVSLCSLLFVALLFAGRIFWVFTVTELFQRERKEEEK